MKLLFVLIICSGLFAQDSWKGTFVQDDDFIRMQYKNFVPKLGKVPGSACLYEITIKDLDATIKVFDTFGLTVFRKGVLTYSTKDTKIITSMDTVFQCLYLYNLYLPQRFGVVFWTRANERVIITETCPLKLVTESVPR